MHILSIGESALQGESNRLCSHTARGCVDNDGIKHLVSTVDFASMGSFAVVLNRREVLEHRHVEVMLIGVLIRLQKLEVDKIRKKRVTCGQTAGLELFLFIKKDISSKGNFSTPGPSVLVSAFEGGHEILRSSQASSQTSGVFERKNVDARFIGPMKTWDPPKFLVEVIVSDVSRTGLVNRCQPDQIDRGPWRDRIVGVRTSRLS